MIKINIHLLRIIKRFFFQVFKTEFGSCVLLFMKQFKSIVKIFVNTGLVESRLGIGLAGHGGNQ